MVKKYVIIICLFIGIIAGMVQNDLNIPVFNDSSTAYYHGIRGKNQISLTINVDWGEEYMASILKILADKNVKATFFVTGSWAGKNPEMLKQISELGHEIGNHGYSHAHPKNLSNQNLIELIKKNEELIYKITGKKTKLFAPPYGEVNERISKVANSIGYYTIMWSADTVDWQRPAPEIIVQRAVNKIDDGGIILMHPTEPSVKALSDIIDILENRNYKFVKVSQLISGE
ncbi:MAG: polysaccharide deacetylase family protein [Halanaerobiaceae bacterium]